VDKHIFTTIPTDEAIAFGGIEPLDGSDVAICHLTLLLL
jgi:hypothetical protein